MKKILKNEISVVILAGGRASRMGGKDKGLIELDGAPLIAYVHEVVKNKASHIFIRTNTINTQYSVYGSVNINDLIDCQAHLAGNSNALPSR